MSEKEKKRLGIYLGTLGIFANFLLNLTPKKEHNLYHDRIEN